MVLKHSKLYDARDDPRKYHYEQKRFSDSVLPPPQNLTQQYKSPDIESITSASTAGTVPITNSNIYPSFNTTMISPVSQQQSAVISPYSQQQQALATTQPYLSNDIDFNSCEFLYDSALFGQIIFDTSFNETNNNKYFTQQDNVNNYVATLPASNLYLNTTTQQQPPPYRHQSL